MTRSPHLPAPASPLLTSARGSGTHWGSRDASGSAGRKVGAWQGCDRVACDSPRDREQEESCSEFPLQAALPQAGKYPSHGGGFSSTLGTQVSPKHIF